jgi:hypothetical protein
MLLPDEPLQPVKVPASLVERPARHRDLVRHLSAIASLRRAGCRADPAFTDDEGRPLPEDRARALRERIEPEICALAPGRSAHARRTVAELRAAHLDDEGQVKLLLDAVYRAHAHGVPPEEAADAFLDTFERWLTPAGIAKVDLVFDRVDLDRAPGSLGLLLLATTRLTRAHFARREAFLERLAGWLLGRSGRTAEDVEAMLQGLRE